MPHIFKWHLFSGLQVRILQHQSASHVFERGQTVQGKHQECSVTAANHQKTGTGKECAAQNRGRSREPKNKNGSNCRDKRRCCQTTRNVWVMKKSF